MLEYESRTTLYECLNVPNVSRMHWSDNTDWIMAEFMYSKVRIANSRILAIANYVALTYDEVSTIEMGHGYLSMPMWSQVKVVFLILSHLRRLWRDLAQTTLPRRS